jgi:antitoxin (DNA-binding transcriptional repressor) of toxin-antitoxin stability system
MESSFEVVNIAELRASIAKFKRQVQTGKKRLVVVSHGRVVGFLIPLEDLSVNNPIPIEQSQEISVSEFRNHISQSWDALQSDVDCFYLTFHKRRIIAFLSPRLMGYLPIPIVGKS